MLKLRSYLAPYMASVVLILALVFFQSLAELLLPTIMAEIVDIGIVQGDIPFIFKMGIWMLLVAAFGMLCSIWGSYLAAKTALGFGKDLRSKVFAQVESFSLQEINRLGTATLITRTTNDITQVQQVFIMLLRMIVSAPLMLIGGIVMAVSKDARLSLILVFALPLIALTIYLIASKGIPLFKAIQLKLDKLNLVLRENLTGIRVIRAFNRVEHEKARYEEANRDLTATTVKVQRIMAAMMPAMMLIMNLTAVSIIWFGGIRVDLGQLEVGDLMAFIQYAMLILFSLVMLSMLFVMLPRAAVSAARINEVLEAETEREVKMEAGKVIEMDVGKDVGIESKMKAKEVAGTEAIEVRPLKKTGNQLEKEKQDLPLAKGPVNRERELNGKMQSEGALLEFREVTFSYPEAEMPALRNISFAVQPGKTTAIIGGTGSGKSTLLKLILGFYKPSQGQITIDGQDIWTMPLKDLRSRIGYVPQKAVLFTGTIADNIRYGNLEAGAEEVRKAAEIAQADEFISQLENNYEAVIAQGGQNLSGGQKQRLAIARALVRRPQIYLFDDSFSALDYKTDAKLRKALQEVTQAATVIVVAQRISTVWNADQIIVLDQGQIVGIGRHQDLLQNCEVYREIAGSQLSQEELA
ncbi:MAG TPA: ABC transporter ATP-binding protein [Peptococcaceae bacterium]|nr:ABC transporter ATP-binding protein [Peptococcaceae bacterium]